MTRFWCLGLLTVFAFTVPAAASVQYPDDVDGYDCAGDMSTDNCFSSPTGTAWSGPVTTQCVAKGSSGQRCKNCQEHFTTRGQPSGYNICAFVARNAACDCTPVGEYKCTGNTSSTCTYSW